jgi:hypothetical protein
VEITTKLQGGTGVGMDSRNEMCRANSEERTTGYAN